MTEPIRLEEVWNPADEDGVFSRLAADEYDVPWAEDDIAILLDVEYYLNVSGEKIISPLVRKLLDDDGTLSDGNKEGIVGIIYALKSPYWAKQWATLSAQYNPIENYSMTETMTDDETVTEYGHTRERTDDLQNDQSTSVYGFNDGDDPTPSGTATGTNTGTVTDEDSGSDTVTRNYGLTRAGNIGVTTSQQMLQSERDLWKWNFFRDVVFPDLDEILTLRVY